MNKLERVNEWDRMLMIWRDRAWWHEVIVQATVVSVMWFIMGLVIVWVYPKPVSVIVWLVPVVVMAALDVALFLRRWRMTPIPGHPKPVSAWVNMNAEAGRRFEERRAWVSQVLDRVMRERNGNHEG